MIDPEKVRELKRQVAELLSASKERDHLRDELAEARRAQLGLADVISQTQELEQKARADNEALRGRLSEAIDWIKHVRSSSELDDSESDDLDAFLAAAPSATATKYRCNSHVDCTNQGAPHEDQRAATEPRREAHPDCAECNCCEEATCSGPHMKCNSSHCDGDGSTLPERSAPASAQGTTGPAAQELQGQQIYRLSNELEAARRTAESLGARLTALAGRQDVHDTGARQFMSALDQHIDKFNVLWEASRMNGVRGLDGWRPFPQRKPEPPQPAPVGTHAFVPGAVGDYCWTPNTTTHPTLIRCGQPRSAAVHGEGGNG